METQAFVTIHKVRRDPWFVIDILSNRKAQKDLKAHSYMLYMIMAVNEHGVSRKLNMDKIISETALTASTYKKAFNELIEKKYLVKNYHKDDVDYYGFYEDPDMPSCKAGFGDNHLLTVEQFLDKYLTPHMETPKDITFDDMALDVIDAPIDYGLLIEKKINSMSYSDFLTTLYWRVIAHVKRKRMRYKCELCGSSKNLNVHHKHYITHGIEHYSEVIDEDLMLVCEKCHQEIHNK